jgi:dihydroorotate dehydrogenase (NAD+) catalytic subunit
MSVAATPAERAREARAFFAIFNPFVLNRGRMWTALQINFSCPNVGLDLTHLTDEVHEVLDSAAKLEIPILVKLNALVPVEVVKTIAAHPSCDAIVCSNTIPWGKLPERIDWKGLFGSDTSPLAKYGGGGLSGKPLLPIVADWIRDVRAAGVTTPIVGGGGILCRQDAERLLDVGADAVEIGSVSILRPWRVRSIIRYVNLRMGTPAQ